MHTVVYYVIVWYFKDICFPIKSKINAAIFYFAKNTLFFIIKTVRSIIFFPLLYYCCPAEEAAVSQPRR